MPKFLLLALLLAAPANSTPQTTDQSREVFQAIDGILHTLSQISGFQIRHRVPAEIISRDKVKIFLQDRIKETATPEELRVEELTLKKFGLVPQDFDLAKNTVDLLTEQAAAFYDFKRKKLFISDWTATDTREITLAHELSHALADQNFNLGKFIKQGRKSDDEALARLAVMEGQASWLMAEYEVRKQGASLADSPAVLEMMTRLLGAAGGQFPVFDSQPLYVRETLVLPYTKGMLFQNAVYQKMGRRGFSEVFRNPPVSSRQILHPEAYFAGEKPTRPPLPRLANGHGYKRIAEGTVGEIDHALLVEQYCGKTEAAAISPHWRGAAYALLERRSPQRVVLLYSSQWDDAAAAGRYFKLYRQVLAKKWKHFEVGSETDAAISGVGDDGNFTVEWKDSTVTSIEGTEPPAPLR